MVVLLVLLTVALLSTPAFADAPVHTGKGDWGPAGKPPSAAEAEWSTVAGVLRSYHIVQENATFTCAHGHLTAHTDEAITGRCGGHGDGTRAVLWAESDDRRWNGTFPTTATSGLAPPPSAPAVPTTNTLGLLVTAAAAFLLAATLLLGLLYLRERRFKDYLVRRLYEETSGRFPHDLPEGHQREVYARVLVKGKN